MMTELLALPYVQKALLAALLIGVPCGYLAIFLHLRGMVFVTLSLSQIAILGYSIALYANLSGILPIVLTLLFVLTGSTLYAVLKALGNHSSRDGEEWLGISYVGGYAISLLLVAKSSQGLEELHHLLSGNILSVTDGEIQILVIGFALFTAIHGFGYHRFLLVALDRDFARLLGIRLLLWELLFHLSLGMILAIAIHSAGVMLVFSSLIMPAAFARFFSRRLPPIHLLALGFSVFTILVGFALSLKWDLPTSECVISVQFLAVLGAGIFFQLARQQRSNAGVTSRPLLHPAGGGDLKK